VELSLEMSLLELLIKHNIQIIGGVPTFEVYVRGSDSYNKNVLSGS
jgi:hypothetical protein